VLAAGLPALLSVWCISPGIGGRGPDESPGAQVVQKFGFPAVWRVELWDSDDVSLILSALETAPFSVPTDRMSLRARGVRWPALAYDLLFAAALGTAVAAVVQWRGAWSGRRVAAAAVLVMLVVALVAAGPQVGIRVAPW
jgi:hypothetical protein